ncbi:MAG: MucR family transcriptional regulator [Pseudolabrys sp.]
MSETSNGNYIELTAEIVSAYVSNNAVAAAEIPGLINQIHSALTRVSGKPGEAPAEPLKPAVSVKKSITPEHIVCLEDGKKFKSLKRHLRTQYNMTPEQYREKWGLGADYPMVAPNYAAARSQLAKQMGLGQQRRRRTK